MVTASKMKNAFPHAFLVRRCRDVDLPYRRADIRGMALAANPLAQFLRNRREKLDPAAYGLPKLRRRTPGLRREEVAQRANVSVTWYTWLEQGRGGAPSADVLDRLARALHLDSTEREHLYLLAQHRPPEPDSQPPVRVSEQVQRVLDALDTCPAYLKNSAWDILAWNHAATAVLSDYARIPPERRNALKLIFCEPQTRAKMPDWESHASSAVATFRHEVARTGISDAVQVLIQQLNEESPEFASMWDRRDVRLLGEGTKFVSHPAAGMIEFGYSSLLVEGHGDWAIVVYAPVTPADRAKVKGLLRGAARPAEPVSLGTGKKSLILQGQRAT